ncbi:MAG: histidine kinase [Vicingaceae bacterium]|nr:histidine kinase [Vicingaceae bacterium]
MLNPITSNNKYLVNYAIVWSLIIGAHFAVLHFYYHISIGVAATDSLLFNVFFAFLGISLWNLVRYGKSNQNFINLLVSHIVSSLLIIGFWLISGYLILRYAIDDIHYLSFLDSSFPWRIISGMFYYSLFILVYYVVVYYQDIQIKAKQEASLKTLIKEVELKALKSQINPHFLFNSLNSVSSLTITSPQKAQEMIIKLSEYLRYSLSNEEQQITTLKTELENIKLYLEIEKIRFGDRLKFQFNCLEETMRATIPAMILQPLFENAIKHGVYESIETITVVLDAEIKGNLLVLELKNDFDETAKPTKGEGIGLNNIQERLFLIYKENNLVALNKTETLFTISLKIPQND